MVVQVSISCMDTGVRPSASPSRISTSCSAFSLNVSIKLTKELGKQHTHQRSPGPAQDFSRPVVRSGGGAPSQPFWPPLKPSSQAGVVVIQLSPEVSSFPSTQDGCCPFVLVLMVPWVLRLPLGPSTLTSRGCDSVESPEDCGKERKKGLWGLQNP